MNVYDIVNEASRIALFDTALWRATRKRTERKESGKGRRWRMGVRKCGGEERCLGGNAHDDGWRTMKVGKHGSGEGQEAVWGAGVRASFQAI